MGKFNLLYDTSVIQGIKTGGVFQLIGIGPLDPIVLKRITRVSGVPFLSARLLLAFGLRRLGLDNVTRRRLRGVRRVFAHPHDLCLKLLEPIQQRMRRRSYQPQNRRLGVQTFVGILAHAYVITENSRSRHPLYVVCACRLRTHTVNSYQFLYVQQNLATVCTGMQHEWSLYQLLVVRNRRLYHHCFFA